ncbi:MAG: hypothetical protein WC501_02180 [Candidatus Micrarchaeia archaeon]
MCGGLNLSWVEKPVKKRQQKAKPKLVKFADITNLTAKAKIIIQEIESANGKYPGITAIIDAKQTLEELKKGENAKELSMIKKLEMAIEPLKIDANPANYW